MAKKIKANNDLEVRRFQKYWQGGLIHTVLGYVIDRHWTPSVIETVAQSVPQKSTSYRSLHL